MTPETITPELIAVTQQQVCDRLSVTLDALAEQMYQTGIEFLNICYRDAHLMVALLEQDALFWKWWRLEWHRRDITFLEDDEVYAATSWRQVLIYQDFNDAKKLATFLRAPRIVTIGIHKLLKNSDGTE